MTIKAEIRNAAQQSTEHRRPATEEQEESDRTERIMTDTDTPNGRNRTTERNEGDERDTRVQKRGHRDQLEPPRGAGKNAVEIREQGNTAQPPEGWTTVVRRKK
mgnify:CR=1 FL=1